MALEKVSGRAARLMESKSSTRRSLPYNAKGKKVGEFFISEW